MELGGNAPFIVFDDADLDAAIADGANLLIGGHLAKQGTNFVEPTVLTEETVNVR